MQKERIAAPPFGLFNREVIAWIIIILGLICRLRQYLVNRSLWYDEALLALKIKNFSFPELFHPLRQLPETYMIKYQAAPFGFFALEKLLVQFLGDSEYLLRLFPFLASVLALFLFYRLVKIYLKEWKAVVFALAIFSSSEIMIYYSSELKPYSSDVTAALMVYLMFHYLYLKNLNFRQVVLSGIVGAILIWFSFPAIFTLLGGQMALTWVYFREKKTNLIIPLTKAGLLWILSFFIYNAGYVSTFTHDQRLDNFWAGMYMPVYPLHMYGIEWYTLKWYFYNFFKIFKNPTGLYLPWLAGILAIVGGRYLLRFRKGHFLILLFPILLTLLASAFHKYPFYSRLLNFLVPSLIIFVGAGIEKLNEKFKDKPLIVWTLVGLLLVHPFIYAGQGFFKPMLREEIKPLMHYIKKHQSQGDIVYLYFAYQYAFRYYAPRYGFNPGEYIIGTSSIRESRDYGKEFDGLKNHKRVWFLLVHVYDNDESLILSYLDQIGHNIDRIKVEGGALYLYDFSREGKESG